MTRLFTAFALSIATLSGCVSTKAIETGDTVTVQSGGGGSVVETQRKYREWARQEKHIIIDGHMISADAFAAFSAPNACYTENAVFSPHAASYVGLIPHYGATERLANRLPAPLRDEFKGSPHFYNWITTARYDYDDLLRIWPDGECKP